jgi:hypothetical protein
MAIAKGKIRIQPQTINKKELCQSYIISEIENKFSRLIKYFSHFLPLKTKTITCEHIYRSKRNPKMFETASRI